MITTKIQESLNEASEIIATSWPLYSFVTSNPLSGFENLQFFDAVIQAESLFGARSFPEVSFYRQALQRNEIQVNEIAELLIKNGFTLSPLESLKQIETETKSLERKHDATLDRIISKWLAVFLDEGIAEWEMPEKNLGFYKSWRKLARFDSEIKVKSTKDIPETAEQVLEILLVESSKEEITCIFKHHLSSLPGWTGFIKHRIENESSWQKDYPISLSEYLAVRLFISKQIKVEFLPKENLIPKNTEAAKLRYLWLKAWEKSFQNQLVKNLENKIGEFTSNSLNSEIPEAQFAFCIDTRSELMRRHIERAGNYETFGYAGFFGIAMDYKNEIDGIVRKACPPIVDSAYLVSEKPQPNKLEQAQKFAKKIEIKTFRDYFLKRLKNMLPSAFGYVEGSGIFYGISLLSRTLFPAYNYHANKCKATEYEEIYEPKINKCAKEDHLNIDIPLDEKVAIVKGAFDLTGWKTFAPLVLFVGHGSHTANNPFGSSLDCGACAASPGRYNARMLAKLANLTEVRKSLIENYSFIIPHDTIFIGAEHNTTTDEIVIFDAEVIHSQINEIKKLKINLKKAQQTATEARLNRAENSISQAQKNANSWSETRPEWGLAKNAAFLVAPRKLTKNLNLDGRCFLHSYDWEQDLEGVALEAIMQGPMVVTQWINNHYYFSTVDNETFGGGSKITHNVTGAFGVVQGNGGDLKRGLPLESIKKSDSEMYHQPLRLSVIIQAPIKNIDIILNRNENLKILLDNEWIYLMVMDPEDNNLIRKYSNGMPWIKVSSCENNLERNLRKSV